LTQFSAHKPVHKFEPAIRLQGATMLAAIALGSNLASKFGDRENNLREAVQRLSALGAVRAISSFYDTEPVGDTDQPRFLNGAVLLETELGPHELLSRMLNIEQAMGRVRTEAKGPRTIDLDLLLVGDVVLETEDLVLPHPEMHRRQFVLEPLAEIAPELMHPLLEVSVEELRRRASRSEEKMS
jgi:2-amino-4-hydroxy-6-hydroxymethyldihydropteridine diphosphokinase